MTEETKPLSFNQRMWQGKPADLRPLLRDSLECYEQNPQLVQHASNIYSIRNHAVRHGMRTLVRTCEEHLELMMPSLIKLANLDTISANDADVLSTILEAWSRMPQKPYGEEAAKAAEAALLSALSKTRAERKDHALHTRTLVCITAALYLYNQSRATTAKEFLKEAAIRAPSTADVNQKRRIYGKLAYLYFTCDHDPFEASWWLLGWLWLRMPWNS